MKNYPLDLISKNLKEFYGKKISRSGKYSKIKLNNKEISVYTPMNKIHSVNIEKIAKELARETKEKKEDVYALLTYKEDIYAKPKIKKNLEGRILINAGLAAVAFILVYLISINSNVTGNAVKAMQFNSITTNGIIASVLILLFILLYKIRVITRYRAVD